MNITKIQKTPTMKNLAYLVLGLSFLFAAYVTLNLQAVFAAEVFTVGSCDIAENQGSCFAKVTYFIEGGTDPKLWNATRNFTISDRRGTEGLEIRLGFGGNVIQARGGKNGTKEATVNVRCAPGKGGVDLVWNETQNKCIRNAQLVGEKSCFIKLNESECVGTMSYNTTNYSGVTAYNATTKKVIARGTDDSRVNPRLTYGKNTIQIRAGTNVVNTLVMTAACGADLVWNGSACGPSGFDIISDVGIYGRGYDTENNSCTKWEMNVCDTRDNMPHVKLDFYMDGKLFQTAKPNIRSGGWRNADFINLEKYQYMPGCGINEGSLYKYEFALPAEYKDNKSRTLTIKATRWNTETNSYRGGNVRPVAYNGWDGYRGYPTSFPIKCAPTAPPACNLKVSDANPALGDKVTLTWDVKNAEGAGTITNNINEGKFEVLAVNGDGSKVASPSVITKYTMTVKSVDGRTASCSRVVNVTDSAKATITATDCEIAIGNKTCASTLNWNITGAAMPNLWNLSLMEAVSAVNLARPARGVNVPYRITHGKNYLQARNNSNVLATADPVAMCKGEDEGKSKWSNGRCVDVNMSATIRAEDCPIEDGANTCQADVKVTFRNVVDPNIFNNKTKKEYNKHVDGKYTIGFGDTRLIARNNSENLAEDIANGSCKGGSGRNPATDLCEKGYGGTSGGGVTITLTPKSNIVRFGERVDLGWEISDITGLTCALILPGSADIAITDASGTEKSNPIKSTETFKVTCTDGTNDYEAEAKVEVIPLMQEI